VSALQLVFAGGIYVPPEILQRPKQGFVLPMGKWLAQWFGSEASVRDYFLARPVPGLDMTEVTRVTVEDLAQGVRRERLLFAILLLIEWYQSFKGRQRELSRECREAVSAAR